MQLLGKCAQLIKNIDAGWAARWISCIVPSYGNHMVTDLARGLQSILRRAFAVEIAMPGPSMRGDVCQVTVRQSNEAVVSVLLGCIKYCSNTSKRAQLSKSCPDTRGVS